MKYENKGLLMDWQNNIDKVAELTKHSPVRTAKKSRLSDLLNTVSTGKIVGAKEKKELNKKKVILTSNSKANPVIAFLECLGSPEQLPAFLAQFYPEMLKRVDYKQACSVATSNILQMPQGRGSGASQAVKSLFVPINKHDPWRDDKKLMASVWEAVNLIAANQVTGHQLSKEPGRGIYVTKGLIMDMLEHPEKATKTKIANALTYFRIAGAIHLAQPDELTDAGLKLTQFNNGSKLVKSHHVYILGSFNTANWDLVASNFNLNLNTPISKEMLIQLFEEQVARNYFPDLSGGVGKTEINFFMGIKAQKGYTNEPIMTAKAAADTISSLASVKDRTARQWVDEVCNVKPVEMEKLSKASAGRLGYELKGYKDTKPAEKLLVPTTKEALRMCREKLADKNDKLKKELKVRMHR
ncbi:hypothetical protein FAM8407_01784 [Lacticaseibacillus paracasei]|jgi:hypothetical protein|uniref:Uncharacterized protein n=1 Tax=Lacticaseibacillus paracasei subsp. paracasei Lpp14 TaxID=1256204 RepID=A0A829H223_LACPA|nr:hypothetical protein [Lacticaseibacillus paracasei]EPC69141.1 hypothetical protein Lpp14_01029 [Lacticaseibacillus paracasei subsp. paracasei Lpp14]RNE45683.1 hypothetical protein FAM8407_01784 [Lacticaseibacillus paracasei]